MKLNINGADVEVDVTPDTPLLWVLRDHLGLKGTRFGCGVGQCGACTVHFDGRATRSCVTPAAACQGAKVRTIEDVAKGHDHPVVKAWIEHGVPQCGYCQSGQIMAATALLETNPRPDDGDIDRFMTNLCRCATYDRIRTAIKSAAATLPAPPEPEPATEAAETDGGEL
jgi:isoquinoline 1-oxidoreductase subunit alpha